MFVCGPENVALAGACAIPSPDYAVTLGLKLTPNGAVAQIGANAFALDIPILPEGWRIVPCEPCPVMTSAYPCPPDATPLLVGKPSYYPDGLPLRPICNWTEDMNGCPVLTCYQPVCPTFVCFSKCPFGFAVNPDTGCPTCDCSPPVCFARAFLSSTEPWALRKRQTAPISSVTTGYSSSPRLDCSGWQLLPGANGTCTQIRSCELSPLLFDTEAACQLSCITPTLASTRCPASCLPGTRLSATVECACEPCSSIAPNSCSDPCRLIQASTATGNQQAICVDFQTCPQPQETLCAVPLPLNAGTVALVGSTVVKASISLLGVRIGVFGPAGVTPEASMLPFSLPLLLSSVPCASQYAWYAVKSDQLMALPNSTATVQNACSQCEDHSYLSFDCNYCVCVDGSYVCTRFACAGNSTVLVEFASTHYTPVQDVDLVLGALSRFLSDDSVTLEIICSTAKAQCYLALTNYNRNPSSQFFQNAASAFGDDWHCQSCPTESADQFALASLLNVNVFLALFATLLL